MHFILLFFISFFVFLPLHIAAAIPRSFFLNPIQNFQALKYFLGTAETRSTMAKLLFGHDFPYSQPIGKYQKFPQTHARKDRGAFLCHDHFIRPRLLFKGTEPIAHSLSLTFEFKSLLKDPLLAHPRLENPYVSWRFSLEPPGLFDQLHYFRRAYSVPQSPSSPYPEAVFDLFFQPSNVKGICYEVSSMHPFRDANEEVNLHIKTTRFYVGSITGDWAENTPQKFMDGLCLLQEFLDTLRFIHPIEAYSDPRLISFYKRLDLRDISPEVLRTIRKAPTPDYGEDGFHSDTVLP